MNQIDITTICKPIEKEDVQSLKFPDSEVLKDVEDIRQRKNDLDRAQAVGSLDRSKIKIFFEDDHCQRVVETTVWAVTDKRVVLKQGVSIPINRIFKLI